VAPADAVGFEDQLDRVGVLDAVQRDRAAFFKAHADFFALDFDFVFPERHAHDRLDDFHTAVQKLQVFGLVRRAQHVRVGRIGFFGAHFVAETGFRHEGRHFSAPAQLVDEELVEPGLVDFQRRVGQQAVAVEALDVVALVGRAVAPDVDIVFLHRGDEHGAGHGAAQRGGVEVGDASGADVEGTRLQRGNAFGGELGAAVDQAGLRGAVFHRLARNLVVIRLVGLAEVGGVGVRDGALELHPVQRGAGVQAAGKGNADFVADGEVLKNGGHEGSWCSA